MTHLGQPEFNNRMAAQRKLLQIVNGAGTWTEELAGISLDAIDRWVGVNNLDHQSDVLRILLLAAKRLQFLSSKSQEQLSAAYVGIMSDFAVVQKDLEDALITYRAKLIV